MALELGDLGFGRRLSSIFGEGEEDRLRGILGNIYGRDAEGLEGLLHGQDAFGYGDLSRLLGSGLGRPKANRFLQDLMSRELQGNRNVEGITQGETPTFDFGRQLTGAFGEGEQDRLQQILANIFGRSEDDLVGLLGGVSGMFGRGDLDRLIGSGLARPRAQGFLEDLFGRLGVNTPDGTSPDGTGDGTTGGGTGPGGLGAGNMSETLDSIFDRYLNEGLPYERRDIDALPPGILDPFMEMLQDIMANPGFDEDILSGARVNIRENNAQNLRDAQLRRADEFAGRNLYGSGPQVRAIEDVERQVRGEEARQLTGLDLANAQAGLTSVNSAISGVNSLGGLNLGAEQLSIQEALGRQGGLLSLLSTASGRDLGLAGLDLEAQRLAMERAIQELMFRLQMSSGFTSSDGTTNTDGGGGDGLDDIIDSILGGGGGIRDDRTLPPSY